MEKTGAFAAGVSVMRPPFLLQYERTQLSLEITDADRFSLLLILSPLMAHSISHKHQQNDDILKKGKTMYEVRKHNMARFKAKGRAGSCTAGYSLVMNQRFTETKLFRQQERKSEACSLTKIMDNIVPGIDGLFDLEDIFPDYLFNFDTLSDNPWINETQEPSNITVQEVLEEILSPTENLLGTLEEPDQAFLEQFINLAKIMPNESNMNSFNTDPIADNLASEPNLENIWTHEPRPEFDNTVVTNVTLTPTSLPEISVDTTKSVVFATNLPLNMDQLDAAAVPLFQDLGPRVEPNGDHTAGLPAPELSSQNNVISVSIPDFNSTSAVVPEVIQEMPPSLHERPLGVIVKPKSRKRTLEESRNPVEGVIPASQKKMGKPCSSTDDEAVPNRNVKKGIKTGLLEQEKELEKQNKELKGKEQELSREVEFLRNYIVSKLRGQCYYCKNDQS